MKKSIILTVVGLVVLSLVASLAFAANSPKMPFHHQENLTDAQKQELAPLFNQMDDLRKQMVEVRKQMIQKEVEFGNITQDQANERIARMNECLENPGKMMGKGHGKHGHGDCNGNQQQAPK